jgi:hypothetical protein
MRVRRASGGREGELLKRAAHLREGVGPLLPKLTPECDTEPFDKLRTALEEIREVRDDEKRLDRVSRFADPMVRAYAGLLRFYLEGELPAIMVAQFPGGEISFAPLGGAPREAQIAVQQSNDPRKLLLGYLTWARKGFHFFATPNTLFCTGRSGRPPGEFLSAQLTTLPYRLQPGPQGRYDCLHLARSEPVPFVAVHWTDAGRSFRVCRRCAKPDHQLLASLTEGLSVPKPESTFTVETNLNVDCHGGERCVHRQLPELPRNLEKQYLYGRLSDAELLDAYRAALLPRLEGVGTPVFVAAGRCYGADMAKFLDALNPTREERLALERVLPDVGGLFDIAAARASRALEKLWPDHAATIVESIVPDPEEAARLVREAKNSPGRVSELLKRAAQATAEARLLNALPHYASLRPEAAFVDRVARAQRTQGSKGAEKVLIQHLPREGKERGIGYGLLVALGSDRPHTWQFTDTEKQFGQALAPLASSLLNAPPEGYHEALGALLGAAGVADWGVRADPPRDSGR